MELCGLVMCLCFGFWLWLWFNTTGGLCLLAVGCYLGGCCDCFGVIVFAALLCFVRLLWGRFCGMMGVLGLDVLW